jgi:DNA repair exonuclease SbcCD ATPase subunit/DNA repair exonuclease SbcCD nuclease subunit
LIIAGDLFEYKTSITPDDILFFRNMIESLETNEIKTIIIPGNHDHHINKYKSDTISSIMNDGDYVRCVPYTCVYKTPSEWEADNISLCIFSPLDNKIPDYTEHDKIKIAVMHEMVSGAVFYSGEGAKGERFTADWLSKTFDITVLGDIHKPQFLANNVAYCGSLVQKNIGEGLIHGYILWNVNSKRGEFKPIPVKEVYLKFKASNDSCEVQRSLHPDTVVKYISLEYTRCSEIWIKDLCNTIESMYNHEINKILNYDDFVETPVEEENIKSNPTEMIEDILTKENYKYKDQLINIHNTLVSESKVRTSCKWSVNYLVFSNILCYGERNYIDFRHIKNSSLVSILGENKTGKSSVIDILVYVLFNHAVRGCKRNILKHGCKSGYIKCSITRDGREYVIEQSIKNISKLSNKADCLLYEVKEGNINTLDGGDLNVMYKRLEGLIGTYKDFMGLFCAKQNRSFLVDEKPKERLETLCRLIDIDMLTSLEETAKTKMKEYKSRIKQLEDISKKDSSEDTKSIEYENNQIKSAILEIKNLTQETKKELSSISSEKEKTCMGLTDNTSYLGEPEDIKTLERKIQEAKKRELDLRVRIGSLQKSCSGISKPEKYIYDNPDEMIRSVEIREMFDNIRRCTRENETLQNELSVEVNALKPSSEGGIKHLKEIFSVIKNMGAETKDINSSIGTLRTLVKAYKDSSSEKDYNFGLEESIKTHKELVNMAPMSIVSDLEFNDDCKSCQTNKNKLYVFSVYKKIKKYLDMYLFHVRRSLSKRLNENVKELGYNSAVLRNSMEHVENKIESLEQDRNHYRMTQEYESLKASVEELETLQKELISVEKEIERLNKCISYSSNIDGIRRLKSLKERETELLKTVDICSAKQMYYTQRLSKNECVLSEREKLNKALEENLVQYDIYQRYSKLLCKRRGLPSMLLKNLCNTLTAKSNIILNFITDFQVKFEFDENIYVYTITRGKQIPADMGSGFQKFVLDLVIRIVLMQISSISKPDMFIIDEGFGCLDQNNFLNVKTCLEKLKYKYKFILIISHIQELRYSCDSFINISRKDECSSVNHGELGDNELSLMTAENSRKIKKVSKASQSEHQKSKKENKKNKEENKKLFVEEYIRDNNTREKVIENVRNNRFYCNVCRKDTTGSIEKHMSTKTHLGRYGVIVRKMLKYNEISCPE